MHIGVFPENPSVTNASIGLPALASQSAGRRPQPDFHLRLLADRPRVQQSAGEHLGHAPGQRHDHRGVRRAPGQGRRRVVWHPAIGVSRCSGARLSHVRAAGLHRQCARRLLLGLPALTGGARLDNPQNLRASTFSLFAHDDWRAAPRLTVSFGLRYDYSTPPADKDDRANLYDPSIGNVARVGTGNLPRGGYEAGRQQPRAARRLRLDARRRGTLDRPRRLRALLQPGRAGDGRGAVFQPALLQPERLLSRRRPAAAHRCRIRFPRIFRSSFRSRRPPISGISQTPWLEHWNVSVQHQISARPRRSKSPMSARAATTSSPRET